MPPARAASDLHGSGLGTLRTEGETARRGVNKDPLFPATFTSRDFPKTNLYHTPHILLSPTHSSLLAEQVMQMLA